MRLAFETLSKIRQMIYLRAFVIVEGGETAAIIGAELDCTVPIIARHVVRPSGDAGNLLLEVFGLADREVDLAAVTLILRAAIGGRRTVLVYSQAAIDRDFVQQPYTVMQTWNELVRRDEVKSIIDIGGRARSGNTQKGSLPDKEILVADITRADDVDFVADVHELSTQVNRTFDAFLSIATFEHLLMPWKAATEINKVLRDGAVGLVITHQTVGMHEVPWDFYRYSNNAWKGIFNKYTGFEIVDAGMTTPSMIIPRQWRREHDDADQAVGYITSGVVVRKVAETTLGWPVSIPWITGDLYPH